MYISHDASHVRQREARLARENRAEIVRALNQQQVTRRELLRWGVFTASGYLVSKNDLSPFAKSAYAAVPTGAPRTPLFGIRKFSQRLNRLHLLKPLPISSRR